MPLSRRSCRILVVASILALPSTARAQVSTVTNQTSTPIQGAGHDYVKMLNETVNPANGSVSARIQAPTPSGRHLSLPFAFAYDSSGAQHVTSNGVGGLYWADNTTYLAKSGWSYSIPMLSYVKVQEMTPGYGGPATRCTYYIDYVFSDASGGRHSLYVSMVGSPQPSCGFAVPIVPAPQLSGGDDYFKAQLTTNTIPPLIADMDGTVYTFNSTAHPSPGSFWSSLPSSIEDRNGNIVTVTDGGTGGAFTVTDTLGRSLLSSSGFGSTGNTMSASGLPSPYTLTWSTATTNFSIGSSLLQGSTNGCASFPSDTNSLGVITGITLPNEESYSFSYDPTYGLLSKITYSSGGYVSYSYGLNPLSEFASFEDLAGIPNSCLYHYDDVAVMHRYVSFDGTHIALQQDFTYSTNWNGGTSSWTTKTTTVTTTDLVTGAASSVAYTYSPFTLAPQPNDDTIFAPQLPLEQSVAYKNSAGTVLRTVNKTWQDQYLLKSGQTALENGLTSQTNYSYGCGSQIVEQDDYDFGSGAPGSLLRKTVTNCQSFNTTPLYPSGPSILDRPCQTIVYDGSGTNRVAETDYLYDGGATVCGSAGTPSVSSVSNLPTGTHDETNYGATSTAPRGNLTKTIKQCFQGGQACASGNPTTTFTFDETGQVLTATDPCGNSSCSDMSGSNHTTTYSYVDNYASGTGTPPGQTNAYLTQVTYHNTGVAHTESFSWGYNDGQLRSSTDQNSQATTYAYNTPPSGCSFPDGLDRLSSTTSPDGGKTTYCYNDTPYNSSTPSPSVTTTKAMTSSTNLTSLTAFDGLGHTIRSVLTSDPDCSSGDRTDTAYDGLGRVYTVSNPYCTTGDSTYGLTTYTYDALGRPCVVAPPTGTPQSNCPSGAIAGDVVTVYAGRATEVFDEGNGTRSVARISQTDGLGRLVSVCEVTGTSLIGSGGTPGACGQDIAATGFLTTYQYDTLDNLLHVNQSGIGARTFIYDSLSRLSSASNPESGTTGYAYDANGNVSQKTDARSVKTIYAYDALNRLTGKTYSDGTPAATFNYDQTSALGLTLANTIGRKSSQSTGGSSGTGSVFSYDSMGRVTNNSQCTPQNCGTGVFAFQYPQYDFLGDLVSGTNAAGVTFTYSYNGAARLTSITTTFVDPTHPGTLFSSAHYAPFGPLTSSTLGNTLNESLSYDKRLRQQFYAATSGTTTLFSFNITSFAPNGDILAANDSVNGNWTYSYDDLNRLSGSNQNSGQSVYSYVYDRFGNRWQQNGPRSMQLSFTGSNNRMDGYSYDAAGNLLNDATHSYFYDAENRLIQVDATLGNCTTRRRRATACYVYDAEGRRVRKTTASGSLDFLYDAQGHKVAEVDTTGTFQRGELYAGDRHFAVYAPDPGPTGATFFIHADWLGTERARTNMTGTACETITSLPFGDGQIISDSCGDSAGDVSPMHFTGKERDSESGLDNFGARFNASNFGRFMSPDPVFFQASMLADPQDFNQYAYVRNNPLALVDPKGEAIELTCSSNDPSKCAAEREKELQALKDAVGKQAGQYLYENKVTTTDANGNTTTRYFVGVYTNGSDANGPAFNSINPVSAAFGAIIQDTRVVTAAVVPNGTFLSDDQGAAVRIGPLNADNPFSAVPGATYTSGGVWHVAILDPSTDPGTLPSEKMSNGRPGALDQGIIMGHEMGHVGRAWGLLIPGPTNRTAVDLENHVRQLKDPNAPIRTEH